MDTYQSLQLTRREAQIVSLLFDGQDQQSMAAQLDVEVGTIKSHLCRVYRKAGIKVAPKSMKAMKLVAMAYRNGGFLW